MADKLKKMGANFVPVQYKILKSHIEEFIEDSNILGCDTVSFGMLLPMFRKIVVP